jgi:molecular chaperone HscB
MNLSSDDFELFGLPRRHSLDDAALDIRRREMQGQVHPDRYAADGAAAQRVAMQWAVRVNEAYRNLKDPLRRAASLCELAGVPIDAERNTAMPADFLMQQLEWREALDDARSVEEVQALADRVAAHRRDALGSLQKLLDEKGDMQAAAMQVRALMFVERFAHDIESRLEALEQ